MKKWIHSKTSLNITEEDGVVKLKIKVIAEVDYPFDYEVAASTYKGFYVPEGDLLPYEKDAIISSQAMQDYYAFIQSVEDLMTQYYGLQIYYKNNSPDNSFYFGALAKNGSGDLLIDFELVMRISNHDPHRSLQSQQHKKEREADLDNLLQGKKRPRPVTKYVLVNNREFANYNEAYIEIDHIIEGALDILKSKEKYRK